MNRGYHNPRLGFAVDVFRHTSQLTLPESSPLATFRRLGKIRENQVPREALHRLQLSRTISIGPIRKKPKMKTAIMVVFLTMFLYQSPLAAQTVYPPTWFTTFRGIPVSGDLKDVINSDDSYLKHHPGFIVNGGTEAPVWLVFEATLNSDSPATLLFTLESTVSTPGLKKFIEAFNYSTERYEFIGYEVPCAFPNDVALTWDLSDYVSDYVQPETGKIRSRIGWLVRGPIFVYPWTTCVDHVFWTTTD